MILEVLRNKLVGDLQQDFNAAFPYLRIDIFRNAAGVTTAALRQKLGKQERLTTAGKLQEGNLEIEGSMTVGALEKALLEQFGIVAQVSRKSGPVWLETTVTDNWTLQQQNEHGRELAIPVKSSIPSSEDYDQ